MAHPPVAVPPAWLEAWSRDHGEERARALFRSTFDGQEVGVWSAPGRVNIIGEHTDYNNGLCLPAALPHRTYVAARLRDDAELNIVTGEAELAVGSPRWSGTIAGLKPGDALGWPAYVAGVVWALQERGYTGNGLDIAIESCVPTGAGLSSSAALECAVALAINSLWDLSLDGDAGATDLAEACVEAENGFVGVPSGGLDQHTALRCADGDGVVIDFASRPPEVSSSPLAFAEYGLAVLITVTNVAHSLRDSGYAQRRAECEEAARQLGVASLREIADAPDGLAKAETLNSDVLRRRARHVVKEIERVRLVADELRGTGPAHSRFDTVGKALYRSHSSLELDFNVSCPELDLAVEVAYGSGALGARMVGGGFGGSTLTLLRRSELVRTANTMIDAFRMAGFDAPRFVAF